MKKSVRRRPFCEKGRSEDVGRSIVLLPNSAPVSAADARGRLEDAQRTPCEGLGGGRFCRLVGYVGRQGHTAAAKHRAERC